MSTVKTIEEAEETEVIKEGEVTVIIIIMDLNQ